MQGNFNQDRTGDWGLTERGFRRPEYFDILDAWEIRARQLFGERANLTVRSPLGMFIRIFAWFGSLAFQVLEDVYNSRFIDTAVGTSLYNLGRFIGVHLLPAQRAAGMLLLTGTPNTIVPLGWLASNVEQVQYITAARGVIGTSGTVLIPARATLPGPEGNAPPNTITQIVNPAIPPGIESVTNPNAFTGGRQRETDEEYRDRYYKSVDFAGGVNAEAIAADILQNTQGVHAAVVFENDMDIIDTNGLPPHSIEAVVYGGLDEDIARCIFKRKAAGIQTYGNTLAFTTADNGMLYEIHFSRPIPKPVWLRLWGITVDPDVFPPRGMELIKEALVNYVGSSSTSTHGLGIGETLYYKRLPQVVYTVPGVINFELTMSADGTQYGYQDVLVSPRAKATCTVAQVRIDE